MYIYQEDRFLAIGRTNPHPVLFIRN